MQDTKRVLITGGAGFIGSNLSRLLVERGVYVDCVDNLITGRMEAIMPLRSNERFRFFELDITESNVARSLSTNRYNEIYHLACPTGVPNIELYGEEMLRTCSTGTENVLQLARAHRARVVYTSSAEVYGNPTVFPQSEDYSGNVDPIGPRSAYEEGKRFAEALVKLYAAKYQVDAKIVRVFNTFGVGMSPDDLRVIPRFLKHIKEQKKLVVYGNGRQTRTYLYIDALLAGLMAVMANGGRGEAYNIGGEEQISIMELVELIDGLTPLTVEVEHKPHFIEDHAGRLPMTTKVRKLGWQPSVDTREGVRRMLVSYGIPVTPDSASSAPYKTRSGAGDDPHDRPAA